MTKTKWYFSQKSMTKTKSIFAVKINTGRISELPQIYPHLYNHSWGDFKDSEKAFHS